MGTWGVCWPSLFSMRTTSSQGLWQPCGKAPCVILLENDKLASACYGMSKLNKKKSVCYFFKVFSNILVDYLTLLEAFQIGFCFFLQTFSCLDLCFRNIAAMQMSQFVDKVRSWMAYHTTAVFNAVQYVLLPIFWEPLIYYWSVFGHPQHSTADIRRLFGMYSKKHGATDEFSREAWRQDGYYWLLKSVTTKTWSFTVGPSASNNWYWPSIKW